MSAGWRKLFVLLLFILLPLSAAVAARPPNQDAAENRAALVIRYGDEQVETYCVSFAEPEITGYELLQRAQLDVMVSDAGLGVTVCQLEEVGCPAGDCFCQCQGESCVYWSYWHQQEGEWQYAVVGAATYPVTAGAVEGWSWGPGSVTEAIAPPTLSFDDVCAPDAAVVEESAEPATVEELPSAVAAVPSPGAPTAAAPAATAVAAPVTSAEAGTGAGLYALFGLIVLALGGLLWWLQRREGLR